MQATSFTGRLSLAQGSGASLWASRRSRALRPVCALSLDRPGERRSPSPPSASAVSTLVPTPSTTSAELVNEDAQSAYEAGYQAGLAAARAASSEASTSASGPVAPAGPVHDSLLRSIVKAFSWRFFSTATTIMLTMTFFSASIDEALEMGAAEFLSKYILFLIHERAWIYVLLP